MYSRASSPVRLQIDRKGADRVHTTRQRATYYTERNTCLPNRLDGVANRGARSTFRRCQSDIVCTLTTLSAAKTLANRHLPSRHDFMTAQASGKLSRDSGRCAAGDWPTGDLEPVTPRKRPMVPPRPPTVRQSPRLRWHAPPTHERRNASIMYYLMWHSPLRAIGLQHRGPDPNLTPSETSLSCPE